MGGNNYTSHHCRHCGDKHNTSKPIGIKKRSPEQIYTFTKKYIINKKSITAEKIAGEMKVKTHQIRQALHRLNLEGLVSQKRNEAHHDSKRDPWNNHPGDSAWLASSYDVLEKED